jgi:CheY-like chemotaxis protein
MGVPALRCWHSASVARSVQGHADKTRDRNKAVRLLARKTQKLAETLLLANRSYRVPLPAVPSADEWANCMRTIAVIDDNTSMLKGLSRLLSAHGFEVQTYSSAELFLECLAKCDVDCLLLDVHLGGISGIDLQRLLTLSGTDLPVIFMTGIDSEATRQEAFDAGCVAYLRKPFSANLLIDAINKAGI